MTEIRAFVASFNSTLLRWISTANLSAVVPIRLKYLAITLETLLQNCIVFFDILVELFSRQALIESNGNKNYLDTNSKVEFETTLNSEESLGNQAIAFF